MILSQMSLDNIADFLSPRTEAAARSHVHHRLMLAHHNIVLGGVELRLVVVPLRLG